MISQRKTLETVSSGQRRDGLDSWHRTKETSVEWLTDNAYIVWGGGIVIVAALLYFLKKSKSD